MSHRELLKKFSKPEVQGSPCRGLGCPQQHLLPLAPLAAGRKERTGVLALSPTENVFNFFGGEGKRTARAYSLRSSRPYRCVFLVLNVCASGTRHCRGAMNAVNKPVSPRTNFLSGREGVLGTPQYGSMKTNDGKWVIQYHRSGCF